MAATNFTPISLYYTTTAAATPSAGNLVAGELALNTLDEKLYFKNSTGTVKLLASNAGSSGSVTSVAATVPAFLSIAGSPITTSGTLAITLSGTALPVANGGTGLTSGTSGGILAYTATGTLVSSGALTQYGVVIGGGAGVAPTSTAAGTSTTVLHGNASGTPTFGAVSLTADVTGNLPVTNLNSGTGATASTFWRGDGTWGTAGTNITLSNDVITATNLYPVFATTTTGTVSSLNTGNAKLLFKPSTGDLQAEQLVAGNGLFINNQTINTSYSVPATQSAMSTGPITLAASVSVTLASGARWVIL